VPVAIFAFFYIAGNQYQTESKHREIFCGFFMDQKTSSGPEKHLGVPRGGHNPLGAPGLLGAPWWVVLTSGLPSGTSLAHWVSFGPEKISKKFRCVWTPFGTDILRSKKQAKNSYWHWALYQ
jgi:hypothetical protein